MADLKVGPLTRDDLAEVWKGALDKSYREPLLAAGDGNGLEAHSQSWEVFARVSKAIDVTTQAMFITPWSGQTNPPAGGARKANVVLTFQRTAYQEFPLRLAAGTILVGEQTTDWGTDGGVTVLTGRRYVLAEDLVLNPGESGPFDVNAQAEFPGYGFNNPLIGTIKVISQPGTGFNNNLATVTVQGPTGLAPGLSASASILTPNEPDMFVPEHVGQYVQFVAGSNQGKVGRIIAFLPPNASLDKGSTAVLEVLWAAEAATYSGTFTIGELLLLANGGFNATGTVLVERLAGANKRLTFILRAMDAGFVLTGATATGNDSGATLTVETALYDKLFVAEAGMAAWRVLDWPQDWRLSVTNHQMPAGGVAGFLDELGSERNLHRAPGEDDDTYRQRVKEIADVVTPNAIRRTLSRTLNTIPWCFREVGSELLRGFFYDGKTAAAGGDNNTSTVEAALYDSYDTDVVLFDGTLTSGTFIGPPLRAGDNERVVLEDTSGNVYLYGYFGMLESGNTVFTFIRKVNQPPTSLAGLRIRGLQSGAIFTPSSITPILLVNQRRFRVYLDYLEFRAFFLVGLPKFGFGEFGFAYDAGESDAYDAAPFDAFYDGFPADNALVYRRVYQAIDTVRGGGVSFDLYIESGTCTP